MIGSMAERTIQDTKLRRLAELGLFSTDEDKLQEAGRAVEFVPVPAGTVLLRAGAPPHWWSYIATGSAVVEEDGVPVAVLAAGDSIGADAIARRARLGATVTTSSDAEVLTIEARRLAQLAGEHWGLALQLAMEPPLAVLSDRPVYEAGAPTASVSKSIMR